MSPSSRSTSQHAHMKKRTIVVLLMLFCIIVAAIQLCIVPPPQNPLKQVIPHYTQTAKDISSKESIDDTINKKDPHEGGPAITTKTIDIAGAGAAAGDIFPPQPGNHSMPPPLHGGGTLNEVLHVDIITVAGGEHSVQEGTTMSSGENAPELTVVDSIMYNGEPIVALRLEMLNNYVDRFYIAEQRKGFSGIAKELLFKEINAEVFKPYEEKITWVLVDDAPNATIGAWDREAIQRNAPAAMMREDIAHGIISEPFVIISTDADEIPDPQVIAEFQPGKKWHSTVMEKPTLLSMKMFYYNFNWVQGNWTKGHVLPGKAVLEGKFNLHQHRVRRNMRMAANVIWDAGWHGSYFLSVEKIIHKIESFSHQEFNKAEIKSEEHIVECIMNGKDLFGRRGSEFDCEHYDYKQLPLPLRKLHEQVCKSQNVTLSGGGMI